MQETFYEILQSFKMSDYKEGNDILPIFNVLAFYLIQCLFVCLSTK